MRACAEAPCDDGRQSLFAARGRRSRPAGCKDQSRKRTSAKEARHRPHGARARGGARRPERRALGADEHGRGGVRVRLCLSPRRDEGSMRGFQQQRGSARGKVVVWGGLSVYVRGVVLSAGAEGQQRVGGGTRRSPAAEQQPTARSAADLHKPHATTTITHTSPSPPFHWNDPSSYASTSSLFPSAQAITGVVSRNPTSLSLSSPPLSRAAAPLAA